MRRHRTTARGILGIALLAGLGAGISTSASAGSASDSAQAAKVPRLVFPLVAKTALWNNYGDPRPNGRHDGIDMENPWRAPVVAVEPGRVEYATSGLGGCMLYLYGASGTTYLYIHLNNDLTRRFDNRGGCKRNVAYQVPDGAKVGAGEQVGWNGDSGDAAGNHHLHFEVHPEDGASVNPFRHLRRAVRPLFAGSPGAPFSLGLRGKLIAAGGGTAQLYVERVRHYPGGRWLEVEPRIVELAVSGEAAAGSDLPSVGGETSQTLKRAVPVVAFTQKARTTPEAIVGGAGALTLQRVWASP